MVGRCPCGSATYFMSINEFCAKEDSHKGGLILRWDQNERQFFDHLDRRWRPVTEWNMESSTK